MSHIDGREPSKAWQAILGGGRNIRFDDAVKVAEAFGHRIARITGSHHILKHPRIPEVLNLQRRPDGTAKAYQLRQLIGYVERYGLKLET